jgi:hypothetical protein
VKISTRRSKVRLTVKPSALVQGFAKCIVAAKAGDVPTAINSVIDTVTAVRTDAEPEVLASQLFFTAQFRAVSALVNESKEFFDPDAIVEFNEDFDIGVGDIEFAIDSKSLRDPLKLPIVERSQEYFRECLENAGVDKPHAWAIASRLPTYFAVELHREWIANPDRYAKLLLYLDSPFGDAIRRELGWAAYGSWLNRQTDSPLFDEAFSLKSVYVPVRASYPRKTESNPAPIAFQQERKVVVDLERELLGWIESADVDDALRIVSGDPGAGKSSFAKMFAARVAALEKVRVLFVPLHQFDPSGELSDAVRNFVRDDPYLVHNPMDREGGDNRLLIIFDGLDELALQGKVAEETARAFVREVQRTLARKNSVQLRLQVLITGRQIVIQSNITEFRRPRQVLTVLPYWIPPSSYEEFDDPEKRLSVDQRQAWWRNYGRMKGKPYDGMPKALASRELDEITAQPLLNYLVALSYERGKVDFSIEHNVNAAYQDLLEAVYERGWAAEQHLSIRNVSLDSFVRILEEIGIAAWHGASRTTTVREIERHCSNTGLKILLDAFQEGARAGVTRLLTAFYFRQAGTASDGEKTFEFTHKSFGEYLAARRIVRGITRITDEMLRRSQDPDTGWGEREALVHWAQLCGPNNIDEYVNDFLRREIALRDQAAVLRWQGALAKLLAHTIRSGLPMESVPGTSTFADSQRQARNAEESLLAAHSACTRTTRKVSSLNLNSLDVFGGWYLRVRRQRMGPVPGIVSQSLTYLDLSGSLLHIQDFYGADLEGSKLSSCGANFACFDYANMAECDLTDSVCQGATFRNANLSGARFDRGRFANVIFREANLSSASFKESHVAGADFSKANLSGVDLAVMGQGAIRLPRIRPTFEDGNQD